jgi:hypothetical protein
VLFAYCSASCLATLDLRFSPVLPPTSSATMWTVVRVVCYVDDILILVANDAFGVVLCVPCDSANWQRIVELIAC